MKKPSHLSLLEEAIIFATLAHHGMYRKGTAIPYITHPLETAAIAATMTGAETTIAAAVLHDVLEDTSVSYEELQARFGIVADIVAAETEDKREGMAAEDSWDTRKLETIERLRDCSELSVKIVALSDKLSNMRALRRDLLLCGEEIWQRFHQKDKRKQGWYYQNVLEALGDLRHYPAWQELKQLIEEVFGESALPHGF